MTQDEIISMAREAGIDEHHAQFDLRIERFAKLVAAHEREACAKVIENLPAPDIYNDTDKSMWDVTCMDCAEAIRNRGQQ